MASTSGKNSIFNSLTLFTVLISIIASGYAQVTLSTGWGPGKRSAYAEERCRMDIPTIFRMCHSLMIKLRHLILCQSRIVEEYGQPEEDPGTNEAFNTHRF